MNDYNTIQKREVSQEELLLQWLHERCLLVSDSNEVGEQLDSKKLPFDTLAQMAQDNLFKNILDMSKYLGQTQYEMYKDYLDGLVPTPPSIEDAKPKFRVVDGQVILIQADNVPPDTTPEEYLRSIWHIPTGMNVVQIQNCMLRGIVGTSSQKTSDAGAVSFDIDRPSNQNVQLKLENLPPHRHHSSITTGSQIKCLQASSDESNLLVENKQAYDMFYNDSIGIGLDRNEMDGAMDQFDVQPVGNPPAKNDIPQASHNNLPRYTKFYAFAIVKA